MLEGSAGADILYAGRGNETLSGGAGRDVSAFAGDLSGHDVIADFHLGQDIVRLTRSINGLAIDRPQDLASRISANSTGAAVPNLGNNATVTFLGMSAHKLVAHIPEMFSIA